MPWSDVAETVGKRVKSAVEFSTIAINSNQGNQVTRGHSLNAQQLCKIDAPFVLHSAIKVSVSPFEGLRALL